jgi:thiol-disulfide isomerase/thioredoxin
MTRASRSALALATVLAIGAGVGAYLWYGKTDEPLGTPGGAILAIHSEPRLLPQLAFQDDKGRKLTLADFRNKVLLLNIWATWCVPCREEMPALDRLQQKLGGGGFEVIALSIDSGGAPAVRRFYDETGVRSLAIYIDPAMRAASSLHVIGVPTTLLVDRKGREIGRHTGPAPWDAPDALQAIKAHMESQ